MTVYGVAKKIGYVEAYKLRRALRQELDKLVADALNGTKYAPGTRELNGCVQETPALARLATQLAARPQFGEFFRNAPMEISRRASVRLVAASVGRVHRCQLSAQADNMSSRDYP